MNALASILLTGTLLGTMAIVATGMLLRMAHGPLRTAWGRTVQQRQREQQRREYWGYE
jgi:hypothetical protein